MEWKEELKMKKLTALLLALMMVFALAACGEEPAAESPAAESEAPAAESEEPAAESEEPAAESEEPAADDEADYANMSTEDLLAQLETYTDGCLTVATSPDFAPYEFYAIDENGEPVLAGFDLALAQYLADFMGLECEIVPMDFDGVLNELAMKTVDIGMAGLSPDPAREGAMAFSDLYYLGGQSFVTVQDRVDEFTTLTCSRSTPSTRSARRTAPSRPTSPMRYCDPNSVVILTKVTDIVAELVNGGLDGAFIETAVAENYAISNPDLAVVLDVPYDQAGSAIGVQLDNPVLLELINRGIAQAIEDGSMDQFVAEANELSTGETYEGLLDEHGSVPEAGNRRRRRGARRLRRLKSR